ncbi:SEL1-like repeat protein [Bifidobacterium margollesii]|uniref:SEL1-like repeat protein n=1 Tax=Bifidobacterium margollesii TaxID=2020964 RepID=UPI001054B013|nr:SEL1-like repeat protein [Bifidobacterium margollesii]
MDDAQAFHWFALGAEMNNPESCYKLGDLYRSGRGCAGNPDKAIALYRKAADIAYDCCNPDFPQDAAVLASIELRLAQWYEHTGETVENVDDRALAHDHYSQSARLFEVATAGGLNWYGKALSSARAGYARTNE